MILIKKENNQISKSDIDKLYHLEKTLAADPTPLLSKAVLAKEAKDCGAVTFFLYNKRIDRSNFIGYSLVIQNKKNLWYHSSLAIYKKHRRKGHARLLANVSLQYAQFNSTGKAKIIGHCGTKNKPMHGLYRAMGFKVAKRMKDHYAPGVDGIEFCRVIEPVWKF